MTDKKVSCTIVSMSTATITRETAAIIFAPGKAPRPVRGAGTVVMIENSDPNVTSASVEPVMAGFFEAITVPLPEPVVPDFEAMTVPQLRKLPLIANVVGRRTMKRDDLLAACRKAVQS